jgi:hypothetical protein
VSLDAEAYEYIRVGARFIEVLRNHDWLTDRQAARD